MPLPVTTQQADAQQGVQVEEATKQSAEKSRLAAGFRNLARTLAAAAAGVNRALNREHRHLKEEAVQSTASAAEHEAELRKAFALYDRNGDGTIDIHELRAVLHAMGQHLGSRELRALMDRMDTDGSGAICYEEFAAVMRDDHAEVGRPRPCPAAFHAAPALACVTCDLALPDMRLQMQETEPEMKQMQGLFSVIDRDGSGKLSPVELQAAIKAMGVVMSRAEVEFLVTQIDNDGDGEVGVARERCS